MSPSKKDEVVQKMVSAIRSKADEFRKLKSEAAKNALEVGDAAIDMVEVHFKTAHAFATAALSTTTAARQMAANPTLRTMAGRLIENAVDDAAGRMNEFANLLDAASKEPTISKAMDDIGDAWEKLSDAMDAIFAKGGKPRHLKPVSTTQTS